MEKDKIINDLIKWAMENKEYNCDEEDPIGFNYVNYEDLLYFLEDLKK